jgi:5-methylcytosine-specific restriction endonuclease McrA
MTLKQMGFYHTPVWRRVRMVALKRDHRLCQWCLKRGTITIATEVHHIKELDKYPDLALDVGNLVSLCHACHDSTKFGKEMPQARVIKI